jgi:nucleoid-associated protein YgaU
MLRKLATATVLLVAVALVTGCAPQVTRTVDPSEGDFYTAEEYQKLKKDQREAYCADLLVAYGEAQDCVDSASADLSLEKAAIGDLEDAIAGLTPRLMSLRSEVDGLQSQIAYFDGLPRVYTVIKGDFLSKIAGMEEVYADPLKWKRIWRANKDVLDGFSDPNLIYPDWALTIPRDWPRSYTVKEGESLWMIAKRWEIYGDGRMWADIFEANGDVLSDPNMIRPGQTLTIPR